MNKQAIDTNSIDELNRIRYELSFGDNADQRRIDELSEMMLKHKGILSDKNDEVLTLVDSKGNFREITSPRWLCHLLGLRHKSVHVLLQYNSKSLGQVFLLQVRSWTKSDSPGRLDISVGGHVKGSKSGIEIETALREMNEELGISKINLVNQKLIYKQGYEFVENQESETFYNVEWRDVYLGLLTMSCFNTFTFSDREVVGLYLCPLSQAIALLNQDIIPFASALEHSFPLCL